MAIDRVSAELTHVRTVLSRTRTAISQITEMPEFRKQYGWVDNEYVAVVTNAPNRDPLHDDILDDLFKVAQILAKYSRK